jgi:hypothetical protein
VLSPVSLRIFSEQVQVVIGGTEPMTVVRLIEHLPGGQKGQKELCFLNYRRFGRQNGTQEWTISTRGNYSGG